MEAGILQAPQPPTLDDILAQFEPLLQAIASVAQGDETNKVEIEEVLPQLEQQGWRLADAMRRIWNGERDEAALTEDIDDDSAALVRRVLALVGVG